MHLRFLIQTKTNKILINELAVITMRPTKIPQHDVPGHRRLRTEALN